MLQDAFVESFGLRMVTLLPRLRVLVFLFLLFIAEEEAFATAVVAIVKDAIAVGVVTAVVLPGPF